MAQAIARIDDAGARVGALTQMCREDCALERRLRRFGKPSILSRVTHQAYIGSAAVQGKTRS